MRPGEIIQSVVLAQTTITMDSTHPRDDRPLPYLRVTRSRWGEGEGSFEVVSLNWIGRSGEAWIEVTKEQWDRLVNNLTLESDPEPNRIRMP